MFILSFDLFVPFICHSIHSVYHLSDSLLSIVPSILSILFCPSFQSIALYCSVHLLSIILSVVQSVCSMYHSAHPFYRSIYCSNSGTLNLKSILNLILNSAQYSTPLSNVPSGKEQETKDSALNP